MQSMTRKLTISSQSVGVDGRVYLSALSPDSVTSTALLILAHHRQSGEEKLIDALLPDDRLATVLSAIRQALGGAWSLTESWEIELFAPMEAAA